LRATGEGQSPLIHFNPGIGWPREASGISGSRDENPLPEASMTTATYRAVLDHPVEIVWSLIRDFNNYPAYIDGVTESLIEDDKRGDEVGPSGVFSIAATGSGNASAAIPTSNIA
jgi:hypothetical protein